MRERGKPGVEWDADPAEIKTWVLDAVFDAEQG